MKNVLCTVGSEKFPFDRLMQWIETIAEEFSNCNFFVQFGSSSYIPKANNIQSFSFLSGTEFAAYCEQADILVGHCGEGTIMQSVNLGKPCILIPRKSSLGEHIDNHQHELAQYLKGIGINIAETLNDLRAGMLEPKYVEFKMNPERVSETLQRELAKKHIFSLDAEALLVCSGGGHFELMQSLGDFHGKFANRVWATFNTKNVQEGLRGEDVIWAHHPTIRNIPNCIKNFLLAFKTLRKRRIDIAISTGAGIAVPFLIVAKIFCASTVVFVESVTRVEGLSLSAKILFYLNVMDYCLVHHEKLKDVYSNNSKIVLISDYSEEYNLSPAI